MTSQLGSEVIADVANIFEDEYDGVNCVISRTMVVIGISQMLEQSQKVRDALCLEGDFRKVEVLCVLLW